MYKRQVKNRKKKKKAAPGNAAPLADTSSATPTERPTNGAPVQGVKVETTAPPQQEPLHLPRKKRAVKESAAEPREQGEVAKRIRVARPPPVPLRGSVQRQMHGPRPDKWGRAQREAGEEAHYRWMRDEAAFPCPLEPSPPKVPPPPWKLAERKCSPVTNEQRKEQRLWERIRQQQAKSPVDTEEEESAGEGTPWRSQQYAPRGKQGTSGTSAGSSRYRRDPKEASPPSTGAPSMRAARSRSGDWPPTRRRDGARAVSLRAAERHPAGARLRPAKRAREEAGHWEWRPKQSRRRDW